jgi:hypothetical protein
MASSKNRCYRISVPDQANSIAIPSDIASCLIRNAGLVDVRINFNDDAESDYYTLKVGADPIKVDVYGGKTLNTDGVGGSSMIEIITWG